MFSKHLHALFKKVRMSMLQESRPKPSLFSDHLRAPPCRSAPFPRLGGEGPHCYELAAALRSGMLHMLKDSALRTDFALSRLAHASGHEIR